MFKLVTLLKWSVLVVAVAVVYFVIRICWLNYQINRRTRRIYKCTNEVSKELRQVNISTDMLGYGWFLNEPTKVNASHKMLKLTFDRLKSTESIHIMARCKKTSPNSYLSFGVYQIETESGEKTLKPVSNNAVITGEVDGPFMITISKSSLISNLTRNKIGFNITNSRHPKFIDKNKLMADKIVKISVPEPSRECNERYLFYFDMIETEIFDFNACKYSYSNIVYNSQSNFQIGSGIRLELTDNDYLPDYANNISSHLSGNLRKITNKYRAQVIDQEEALELIKDKISLFDYPEAEPLYLNRWYSYSNYKNSLRSDVTRFITPPIKLERNNQLDVYFGNYPGATQTRISLINKEGHEFSSVCPSDENRVEGNLHHVVFEVQDKEFQVVESVYNSENISINPHQLHPMVVVETGSIFRYGSDRGALHKNESIVQI